MIANVSRTVIPALRQVYANVMVVSITAPADVLAARLAMRRRGSDGNIAELKRAAGAELASRIRVLSGLGEGVFMYCMMRWVVFRGSPGNVSGRV